MKRYLNTATKSTLAASVALTLAIGVSTPAKAGNDFLKTVVGGAIVIGAIKEFEKIQKSKSGKQTGSTKKPDPVVKSIQTYLNELGYPAGKPDGFAGKNTNKALTQFMSDQGTGYDGTPSQNELAMLEAASKKVNTRLSTQNKSGWKDPDTVTQSQSFAFNDIPSIVTHYHETFAN